MKYVLIIFSAIIILLSVLVSSQTIEQSSPSDWVQEDQIKVYDDHVKLAIPNAQWAAFTNTNSMDPFLDETAHALEIIPENPNQINVGDVVAYKFKSSTYIHRVIEKDTDTEGFYYVVKGDNNPSPDPVKVRFKDITGVVIAVIY